LNKEKEVPTMQYIRTLWSLYAPSHLLNGHGYQSSVSMRSRTWLFSHSCRRGGSAR